MKREVNSWYQSSRNDNKKYPILKKDIKCDVVMLGGGYTAISSAIHLVKLGYKCVVLEAKSIGWGASGRNGGHFLTGFSCSMKKIVQLVGKNNANLLYKYSIESINLINKLVKEYKIECDLQHGYYHAAIKNRQIKEIKEFIRELKEYNHPKQCQFIGENEIKEHIETKRYKALMYDPFSGHLHPLNLLLGLARAALSLGVRIFEQSSINEIINTKKNIIVKTANGEVKAKKLIVAGNAYLKNIFNKIERRILPVSTYIVATERLTKKANTNFLIKDNRAVADLNNILDYYRMSNDNRMLYGGRASYLLHNNDSLKKTTYKKMIETFPQLKNVNIEYSWGGLVGITINRAPYFGKIGENIYFMTGFSGHGVSLTLLAGKLAANVINGESSGFNIFKKIPHQPFIGGKIFRAPLVAMAMLYYKLLDKL